MPTLFTKLLNGEIPCHKVWEDERHFAFLDIRPIQPGMTLVVPKQEIDYVFDLDDGAYTALMLAAKHLTPAIQQATGCARVGMVIEGLEIPHAHVKLIPISPSQGLGQENARDTSPEELRAMAEKIRSHLS